MFKKVVVCFSQISKAKMAEHSIVIATGKDIVQSLGRHFSYELSDRKAQNNLIEGASREALEVEEKQICTVMTFSVGAFAEVVIPTVVKKSLRKI